MGWARREGIGLDDALGRSQDTGIRMQESEVRSISDTPE